MLLPPYITLLGGHHKTMIVKGIIYEITDAIGHTSFNAEKMVRVGVAIRLLISVCRCHDETLGWVT